MKMFVYTCRIPIRLLIGSVFSMHIYGPGAKYLSHINILEDLVTYITYLFIHNVSCHLATRYKNKSNWNLNPPAEHQQLWASTCEKVPTGPQPSVSFHRQAGLARSNPCPVSSAFLQYSKGSHQKKTGKKRSGWPLGSAPLPPPSLFLFVNCVF